MGKAIVLLFGLVILCSVLLAALYYIGIIVVICVVVSGVFGLANKHMECETIKHGIDREFDCRMFEINKKFELKNKQLDFKYKQLGLTCDSSGKKSDPASYIDV